MVPEAESSSVSSPTLLLAPIAGKLGSAKEKSKKLYPVENFPLNVMTKKMKPSRRGVASAVAQCT